MKWVDVGSWQATFASLLPLWLLSLSIAIAFSQMDIPVALLYVAFWLFPILSLVFIGRGWMTFEVLLYSLFPFLLLFSLDETSMAYRMQLILVCTLFLSIGIVGYHISLNRDKIGLAWLILFLVFIATWFLASHANQNYWQMAGELGYPTGADVFRVVERYLEVDPGLSILIIDEDFLLNRRRAMEFRDCVLKAGKQLSIFVFASIKALSQYTVTEILEMGIDGVWIGYEGTRSGYAKQSGRPVEEIFREFREHGITILASMIVGFPYQTPEIIEEELSGLLALKPVFTQFLIYGPCPGTPFYEQVVREGTLVPEVAHDKEQGLGQVGRRHGVRPALGRRRLLRRGRGRRPGPLPSPRLAGHGLHRRLRAGALLLRRPGGGDGRPGAGDVLWVPASCLTHTGVQ